MKSLDIITKIETLTLIANQLDKIALKHNGVVGMWPDFFQSHLKNELAEAALAKKQDLVATLLEDIKLVSSHFEKVHLLYPQTDQKKGTFNICGKIKEEKAALADVLIEGK